MKNRLSIWALILIFCFGAGIASAGVPEISAPPVSRIEPGEEFDVDIFVVCHAVEADYTVTLTLHPRFEFVEEGSGMVIADDNASITITGYDKDNPRFEFPMRALNDTPDGDYNIQYAVYWNGSETGFRETVVDGGSVRVSVGEGGEDSPCSSTGILILPILAIVTAFCIVKKKSG
jgi:hypothetical protein